MMTCEVQCPEDELLLRMKHQFGKSHSLKKSKAILETQFKQAKICPVYGANLYFYIPVSHKGKDEQNLAPELPTVLWILI